ncbi:Bifunctional arginine demethylase and lysyl-hydroxylase JMJD6 [Hondaea fermentalgiana]|uniref:Bifunctional arginine demethylase and lysyl-hydroxylase JMJD6 n=1 Tax=Hondaea fermentalgiana TaxID=2315210 RepID=A0A2R5G7P1_9STRA|nr:Bifunctional arginine demethylase and lysyl-hydroxylase JMJD6 [Hondaea fermentalgiana]|eukprot:GBG25818.1 Bifunctional arginine demethylase and lysyl-hydroxylase JMJD6 [Hondaea fermentalgiana]
MGRKKASAAAAAHGKELAPGKKEELGSAASGLLDKLDAIPMSVVLAVLFACGLALLGVKVQSGEVSMPRMSSDLAFEHIMSGRPAAWYKDKHEVVESLPVVTNMEQPFSHATLITTKTFKKEVLEASKDELVLVVFYDPRSHAFQLLHSEIDASAKHIQSHPRLAGRVRIGVVNAAVDAWLGKLYAWLGRTQQDTTKTAATSFQFGHETTYMMLSRLFRNGRVLGAYKGIYDASDILNYLDLALEPLEPRRVPNVAALEAMVTADPPRLPLIASCDSVLSSEAFTAVAKWFHGRSFFARVDDAAACASSDGGSPCTLASFNARGERHCYVPTSEVTGAFETTSSTEGLDKFLSDPELEAFVRLESRTQLEELREDNVHVYLRKPFVCALLLDLQNIEQLRKLTQIVESVRKSPHVATIVPHVEFVLADAKSMAAGYDLADDGVNAILFQASLLTSAEHESIYMPADPLQELSGESIEWVATGMASWLERELSNDLQEFIRDHALFVRQGGVDRAEKGAVAASHRAAQTDVQKKQPELEANAKPQVDLVPEKESFEATNNLVGYQEMKLSDVLKSFAGLYTDYAMLEEIWEDFTPAQRKNEVAMRNGLEMVRNYIQSHAFLHDYVQTIPLTPRRLRDTTEGKGERKELMRAIERFASKTTGMLNDAYHVEERGEEDLEHYSLKLKWSEAAAFFEFALYDIYAERSDEYKKERAAAGNTSLPQAETLQIDRRSADELSMEEFAREYAGKGRPVIIENAKLTRETWNLAFFREHCGDKFPNLVTLDRSQRTWGGLVSVPNKVSMAEFVDTHRTMEERKAWYVHDWSLPHHCPNVFGEAPYEEFTLPKYFAGDYAQRLPFEGYQHSWPSLFVGANGTQSLMHVDSGGTNFWMYLVSGVKEWRFFERHDIPNLYSRPLSSSFAVDPFEQDGSRFPLVGKAKMYHGTQRPGDLVFVPGGSPHGVRNLDDVVGLSMNYIDDTNMWLYLWTQLHSHDFRAFETLTQSNFPRGLRKNQTDISFGEFKSTDWYKLAKEGKLDLVIDNYKPHE